MLGASDLVDSPSCSSAFAAFSAPSFFKYHPLACRNNNLEPLNNASASTTITRRLCSVYSACVDGGESE